MITERIEHIYAHREEDHAIRQFAHALEDGFMHHIVKANRPYVMAILRLIQTDPDTFRKCGYSFQDIRFRNHVQKKGKCVSCEAYFDFPDDFHSPRARRAGSGNRKVTDAERVHTRSVEAEHATGRTLCESRASDVLRGKM